MGSPEKSSTVRIRGLTRLEQRELQAALPAGAVDVAPEQDLVGAAHGELSTWMAVIEATQLTLPVLAAWLLKSRSKTKFEVEVEQTRPDGSSEVRRLRLDTSASSAPQADVLQQLSAVLAPPASG